MSLRLSASAACLVALSLGCAAGRHPPPIAEPAGAAELRQALANWVVGVREPEVRYSEPDDPRPDVLDEVRDAGYLVEAFRGTGLFAEVDFTRQLQCPPNMEVVVIARKEERYRPAPLWLWPLTLSLVILNDERGVAFAPAGDPAVVFELPYPTTLVVGLLPLIASPVLITGAVPSWSFASTGGVDKQLELFLLSNADRLRAFARDPDPKECHRQ
jgi:hypothetical protein